MDAYGPKFQRGLLRWNFGCASQPRRASTFASIFMRTAVAGGGYANNNIAGDPWGDKRAWGKVEGGKRGEGGEGRGREEKEEEKEEVEKRRRRRNTGVERGRRMTRFFKMRKLISPSSRLLGVWTGPNTSSSFSSFYAESFLPSNVHAYIHMYTHRIVDISLLHPASFTRHSLSAYTRYDFSYATYRTYVHNVRIHSP